MLGSLAVCMRPKADHRRPKPELMRVDALDAVRRPGRCQAPRASTCRRPKADEDEVLPSRVPNTV